MTPSLAFFGRRRAFEKEGFPIPTEEQVRSVIGPPFEIGLPQIGIPDDDLERAIDRYRERCATMGAFENTLSQELSRCSDAQYRWSQSSVARQA